MNPKLNKTELHAELVRIDSRVRAIRAMFHGSAIDKAFHAEIVALAKSREFVMSELKK